MEKLFGESLCNLLLEWGMFKHVQVIQERYCHISVWWPEHEQLDMSSPGDEGVPDPSPTARSSTVYLLPHQNLSATTAHYKMQGKKDTIRGLLCQCKAITYQVWWQNSQAPESWTARKNQIKDVQMWAKWYKWSRTHSSGREISSTCIVLAWTRSPVSNADMSLLTWHPT